jgi:hypothetical protein
MAKALAAQVAARLEQAAARLGTANPLSNMQ